LGERKKVMESSIRKRLFENYAETHKSIVQGDWDSTYKYLQRYFLKNYFPILKDRLKVKNPKILEIGCNNGAGAAALKSLFPDMDYTGVDLSPKDIETAEAILGDPTMQFVCTDGAEWCTQHAQTYDLIIFKAVLEHIPKNDIEKLLLAVRSALSPEGVVFVDVPNMDWIYASHERYMDLTHECGYTYESLGQLFRNYFSAVEVHLAQNVYMFKKYKLIRKAILVFSRFVLGLLLYGAEPYIAINRLWNRSIIVIANNFIEEK